MKGGQKKTGVRITFLLKKKLIYPSENNLYYINKSGDEPAYFSLYSNGVIKKNITGEHYFQESEYYPLKINPTESEKILDIPENINKNQDKSILKNLNKIKFDDKGKHILYKLFFIHDNKHHRLQNLLKGGIKIPNTNDKYRIPWKKNKKRVEGIKKNKKNNEHNTYLRYFDNSDIDGYIYLIEPTNWSYNKLNTFIDDVNSGDVKLKINMTGETKSDTEPEPETAPEPAPVTAPETAPETSRASEETKSDDVSEDKIKSIYDKIRNKN